MTEPRRREPRTCFPRFWGPEALKELEILGSLLSCSKLSLKVPQILQESEQESVFLGNTCIALGEFIQPSFEIYSTDNNF